VGIRESSLECIGHGAAAVSACDCYWEEMKFSKNEEDEKEKIQ
jgi:hypothetical protein